jgi:hypothetical protein
MDHAPKSEEKGYHAHKARILKENEMDENGVNTDVNMQHRKQGRVVYNCTFWLSQELMQRPHK